MKQTLSIAFLLLSTYLCAQSKDCTDVKNGKFKYIDSQSNEFIVKRTDSIQIDSCLTKSLVFYSKIKWKSDCDYEMEIYKVSDSLFNPLIGNVFELNILSVDNNKIKLKSKTLNGKRESENYMEIIE